MAISESLLPELHDHEMGTTRRLLERAPEAKFVWRPHQKSWTMGELAAHLAQLPVWAGVILDGTFFDITSAAPDGGAPKTRAEMLQQFDKNVSATRATIAGKSDGEWMAPWTLKRGGQEIFTVPRVAAFRSFVMSHIIHHRGQFSVYLRLTDTPIPPIYGPSADEQW